MVTRDTREMSLHIGYYVLLAQPSQLDLTSSLHNSTSFTETIKIKGNNPILLTSEHLIIFANKH